MSQSHAVYLGTLALLTFIFVTFLVLVAISADFRSQTTGCLFQFCRRFPNQLGHPDYHCTAGPDSGLDLGVERVELGRYAFAPPPLAARMETAGLPEEAGTMVVVPTFFSSEDQVNQLLEKLEVHFLANQDKQIYFALLGDFADANSEHAPDDARLLEAAQTGIAQLNHRHSHGDGLRFICFIAAAMCESG